MSTETKVEGEVIVKGEEQSIGSNGFRKQELVVMTQDQYPKPILLEFIQDNCDKLDNVNVGDKVSVSYTLTGRAWDNPEGITKYFNAIQGWKIEKTGTDF